MNNLTEEELALLGITKSLLETKTDILNYEVDNVRIENKYKNITNYRIFTMITESLLNRDPSFFLFESNLNNTYKILNISRYSKEVKKDLNNSINNIIVNLNNIKNSNEKEKNYLEYIATEMIDRHAYFESTNALSNSIAYDSYALTEMIIGHRLTEYDNYFSLSTIYLLTNIEDLFRIDEFRHNTIKLIQDLPIDRKDKKYTKSIKLLLKDLKTFE